MLLKSGNDIAVPARIELDFSMLDQVRRKFDDMNHLG